MEDWLLTWRFTPRFSKVSGMGKLKKNLWYLGENPPFVDDVPIKTRRFTIAKVPGIMSFCDDPPSTQVFLRYFLMENLMESSQEIPVQEMIFKWWVFHIYVKLLEGNG
jgi:hypothetical protein